MQGVQAAEVYEWLRMIIEPAWQEDLINDGYQLEISICAHNPLLQMTNVFTSNGVVLPETGIPVEEGHYVVFGESDCSVNE